MARLEDRLGLGQQRVHLELESPLALGANSWVHVC